MRLIRNFNRLKQKSPSSILKPWIRLLFSHLSRCLTRFAVSFDNELQYQTIYPQKFFDILAYVPVYRPETRRGGGASSLHFPAATPLPPPPQGQHPPPPPPPPPSIPRRKPRHGLCIQTVPRFVVSKAGPAFECVQLARVENTSEAEDGYNHYLF